MVHRLHLLLVWEDCEWKQAERLESACTWTSIPFKTVARVAGETSRTTFEWLERCLGLRFHDRKLLFPGPYEASGPRVFASAELDPGRSTVWGFPEPSPRLPRGRPTQKRRKRSHGRNNDGCSLINSDALRQGLAEGEFPGLPLGRSHQNRHPAPDGGRS